MARPRKTRILKIDGRKKPHRVIYWEGDSRKTSHFEKKIDAELFARQHGWEAMDPSLAVSAEERILIGKARSAAAALGVDAQAIVEAGLKAMRLTAQEAPPLSEAIKLYIDAQDLAGGRTSSPGEFETLPGQTLIQFPAQEKKNPQIVSCPYRFCKHSVLLAK
jgi:hypothetical protein